VVNPQAMIAGGPNPHRGNEPRGNHVRGVKCSKVETACKPIIYGST